MNKIDIDDNKVLQKTWEQLTIFMLRKGFGVLWMLHFVTTQFDKLCEDDIMRKRIGVESKQKE